MQLGNDRVGAGRDPAGEVAITKGRQNLVLDDERGQRVSKITFEAIADLDPHLAVIGRDQQQRSVVPLGITQTPGAAQLVAVIGNVVALQIRDRGDHQLPL